MTDSIDNLLLEHLKATRIFSTISTAKASVYEGRRTDGHELIKMLNIPVDVLTPNALPEKFRASVLANAQPI